MILEICANGFKSAAIAQKAGANRIELCENLSIGGVTPLYETIKKVKEKLRIPTHVLIRPRGGDFIYTNVEIEQMLEAISFCKAQGCEGIVSGALTREGTLDVTTTQKLINASKGMEFTFHRAFDVVENPFETLQQLERLGVTRILSSGQQPKAINGIEVLKQLKSKASTIQIMPGSGITSENVKPFKQAGFDMIHFSAIKKNTEGSTLFNKTVTGYSNLEEIEKIKKIVTS